MNKINEQMNEGMKKNFGKDISVSYLSMNLVSGNITFGEFNFGWNCEKFCFLKIALSENCEKFSVEIKIVLTKLSLERANGKRKPV